MDRRTIMIVDDELEVLDILNKKLMGAGYNVVPMQTGKDALIEARHHPPDLILMDIVLPDIDGSEAVRQLQDIPVTADIPIIFLSGIIAGDADQSLSEVTVAGRQYRALGKPFSFQELLAEVQSILR